MKLKYRVIGRCYVSCNGSLSERILRMVKTSGYRTERPMASRLDYGVPDKMQIHLRLPPGPSVDLADERQECQPEGCPARDEESRRPGSNQETSSICALQAGSAYLFQSLAEKMTMRRWRISLGH